jgi:hypothetical protein
MKIWKLAAVFLFAGMFAGCSTFHETGNGAKEVGTTVKEDFRTIGPTMKKGFGQVGSSFKEGGQQVGRDVRDAGGQAKNPFK